ITKIIKRYNLEKYDTNSNNT
ncbi:hypothetical protein ACLGTZ_001882, partial [Campylobacter jejuni]